MSNTVSNPNVSPQKQQDFTEVDSDAEDEIASNLTGAAPMGQLNGVSVCDHMTPEPTPAQESVNGSTHVNQSRWSPDTVRSTKTGRLQPFVLETPGVPDTKSSDRAEIPQTIPADRQAEPSPAMTTGSRQPPTVTEPCSEASRRFLASQIKHLTRRRATAARVQPSQSGSSPSSDQKIAPKPQSEE